MAGSIWRQKRLAAALEKLEKAAGIARPTPEAAEMRERRLAETSWNERERLLAAASPQLEDESRAIASVTDEVGRPARRRHHRNPRLPLASD